jgi:hypothetical protein
MSHRQPRGTGDRGQEQDVTADRRCLTPAAFRSAADARIGATARRPGRPLGELRREFLYQRFLSMPSAM